MPFQKATKEQAKLRLALIGPAGSGKTYSALTLATHLVPNGHIALIDSERGSASKYADRFNFDVEELTTFHPQRYIQAINDAQTASYDVLIIDSLSHAWMGKDGACRHGRAVARGVTHSRHGTAAGRYGALCGYRQLTRHGRGQMRA